MGSCGIRRPSAGWGYRRWYPSRTRTASSAAPLTRVRAAICFHHRLPLLLLWLMLVASVLVHRPQVPSTTHDPTTHGFCWTRALHLPSTIASSLTTGLAECCHLEGVSLLAYSPLAMGLLTGKYTEAAEPGRYSGPPEARLNRYRGRYAEAESRQVEGREGRLDRCEDVVLPHLVTFGLVRVSTARALFLRKQSGECLARASCGRSRCLLLLSRYGPRPNVISAVREYSALAAKWGMAPTELALRFVLDRPLVASTIFGASTEPQLLQCIQAVGKGPLPEELRAEIDGIHERYPNPTP